MKASNILIGAVVGTAAMTAFSYIISSKKHKNFREPALLGRAVENAVPALPKPASLFTGWLLHLGAGVALSTLSQYLWKKISGKKNPAIVLPIGFLNGGIGVATWKLLFRLHPAPPRISFRRFYGHLVLAHLIFTATVIFTGEGLAGKEETERKPDL